MTSYNCAFKFSFFHLKWYSILHQDFWKLICEKIRSIKGNKPYFSDIAISKMCFRSFLREEYMFNQRHAIGIFHRNIYFQFIDSSRLSVSIGTKHTSFGHRLWNLEDFIFNARKKLVLSDRFSINLFLQKLIIVVLILIACDKLALNYIRTKFL